MMLKNKINRNLNRITIWILALLILVILLYLPYNQAKKNIDLTSENTKEIIKPEKKFSSINTVGESVIVFDLNNDKILFSKKENSAIPLASITKIVTALTASDFLSEQDIITINYEDVAVVTNAGLEAGQVWNFKDLRDFMMTTSSNGAARAISRKVREKTGKNFIDLMNKKAEGLGLNNMNFFNETGLDENNKSGGYGSALEVAKLLKYTLNHKLEILQPTTLPTITVNNLEKPNTNIITKEIPGLLGSKTGFTGQAGGNLAVIIDIGLNQPIAIVVLGSTIDDRFTDINKLTEATLSYYSF